ncbi:hypothetical protein JOS77_07075 [Chromobacterium haemolyticum]|nr:hypothetical protein JOS77_07075 [Chromobacterium haemolyticum]
MQSIITPLTEIARDDLKLFEALHNKDDQGRPRTEVLKIQFDKLIDPKRRAEELDWSHSNLSQLYEIGYQAGQDLLRQHRAKLLG